MIKFENVNKICQESFAQKDIEPKQEKLLNSETGKGIMPCRSFNEISRR